jgi:flagellar motor switch protein FliG
MAVDVDSLTGPQKMAILCLALGTEAAAKITQKLQPQEVDAISMEIARLEQVSPMVVEQVLDEWLSRSSGADSLAAGGVDAAQELLEKAFGARKAAQVMERIQPQIHGTGDLQRLRSADPEQLARMLAGEHPQTVAFVLAHLDAANAADVLRVIDRTLAAEVAYRIGRMEKVSPEYVQLIERSLSADTSLSVSQRMNPAGGPAAVAAVLNSLDSALEKALLEGVAERDAALCDQIKNLMFVFEDVGQIDNRSLQRVLRDIDGKELALALKAVSPELKTKITSAMSQRAVQALNDEMEMMGPVRMKDVETAQANIVATVRKLEELGEIVLAGGDDDLIV